MLVLYTYSFLIINNTSYQRVTCWRTCFFVSDARQALLSVATLESIQRPFVIAILINSSVQGAGDLRWYQETESIYPHPTSARSVFTLVMGACSSMSLLTTPLVTLVVRTLIIKRSRLPTIHSLIYQRLCEHRRTSVV